MKTNPRSQQLDRRRPLTLRSGKTNQSRNRTNSSRPRGFRSNRLGSFPLSLWRSLPLIRTRSLPSNRRRSLPVEPAAKPSVDTAAKPSIEPALFPGGAPEKPPAVTRNSTEQTAVPASSTSTQGAVGQPIAAPEAPEHSQTNANGSAAGGATEARPIKRAAKDTDGWVKIENSGSLPIDPTDKVVGEAGDAGSEVGSRRGSSNADSRFHAARNIEFEPEPSQSTGVAAVASEASAGARSAEAAVARAPLPRAASHSERVEANEHVVERGENYWTISRQYWGSGRYFAALWKANAANHPDINVLRVGDVIVVPSIEDLNSEYIVPEGKTASTEWLAGLGITLKGSRPAKAGSRTDSNESVATEGRTRHPGRAESLRDGPAFRMESSICLPPRP